MKLGMKILALSAVAACGFLISGLTMASDDQGELVPVAVNDVFVPQGFDNNDEAVVVLDGYLPSSCYKLTRALVTVDQESQFITVTAQARKFAGPCIQVLVPFSTVVGLGILPMGDYVVQTKGGNLRETLNVKESRTSGPDDVIYAPVDDVAVNNEVSATRPIAILSGRLTNTCMRIGSIKVVNSGKTLEILPELVIEDRADCTRVEMPFRVPVELAPAGSAEFRAGRYLAHVRSLNGQSVNSIFSVQNHSTR